MTEGDLEGITGRRLSWSERGAAGSAVHHRGNAGWVRVGRAGQRCAARLGFIGREPSLPAHVMSHGERAV